MFTFDGILVIILLLWFIWIEEALAFARTTARDRNAMIVAIIIAVLAFLFTSPLFTVFCCIPVSIALARSISKKWPL